MFSVGIKYSARDPT